MIRGYRGNAEVRGALIRFAKWLRRSYEFPIRLPVYLNASETLVATDGRRASALFFAPWRGDVEPYIRIATGDYPLLAKQRGRDNALAAFILSLSHEVVHYQQWVASGTISERGARLRAMTILRAYEASTPHP